MQTIKFVYWALGKSDGSKLNLFPRFSCFRTESVLLDSDNQVMIISTITTDIQWFNESLTGEMPQTDSIRFVNNSFMAAFPKSILSMFLENRNRFIIIIIIILYARLMVKVKKKNKTITLHKGMCYKRFNQIIKKIRFKWLIHDSDIASTKTYAWLATHKPSTLFAIHSYLYILVSRQRAIKLQTICQTQSPADLLGSARVVLWMMGSFLTSDLLQRNMWCNKLISHFIS